MNARPFPFGTKVRLAFVHLFGPHGRSECEVFLEESRRSIG